MMTHSHLTHPLRFSPELIKGLSGFYEYLKEPWLMKDHESYYLYANPAMHKLLDLPPEAMLGQYGHVLAATSQKAKQFTAAFEEQEKQQTSHPKQFLFLFVTSVEKNRKTVQPYQFDQFEGGKGTYTINSGKKFCLYSFGEKNIVSWPTAFTLVTRHDPFTEDEFELLYLMQSCQSDQAETLLFHLRHYFQVTGHEQIAGISKHSIEHSGENELARQLDQQIDTIDKKMAITVPRSQDNNAHFEEFDKRCKEKEYEKMIPTRFLETKQLIQ